MVEDTDNAGRYSETDPGGPAPAPSSEATPSGSTPALDLLAECGLMKPQVLSAAKQYAGKTTFRENTSAFVAASLSGDVIRELGRKVTEELVSVVEHVEPKRYTKVDQGEPKEPKEIVDPPAPETAATA